MDTTNERKLKSVTINLAGGGEETIECTAAEVYGAFLFIFDDDLQHPKKLMSVDIIVEVDFNYDVQEKTNIHTLKH